MHTKFLSEIGIEEIIRKI